MEMKGRKRRLSLLAWAYSALVLVALAALAVLLSRRAARFDVTEGNRHSLKPSTQALLDSIPEGAEPVDLVVVTSGIVAGGNSREAESQVRPLLLLLEHGSPRIRTSVRFAEHDPSLVESLTIDKLPLAVLHWQPPKDASGKAPEARERRTLAVTEDGIAQALRELLENQRRVAYMLIGHDEMRKGDAGGPGLSLFARTLEGLSFDVRELALVGAGRVPDDADLVVVAGPQADLLPEEIAALQRHADAGGRFLVLDGPTREPGGLAALNEWLGASWNLGPLFGVVADFDVPLGGDPRILLVLPKEDGHEIVAPIRKVVQMPVTRGISFLDRPLEGVAAGSLLRSGERSWLETDLASQAPRFDPPADLKGPFDLAWAVKRKPDAQEREARMVAFGSRMAFADQFIGAGGNMELLRNAVDWATGRESDIAKRSGTGHDGSVIIARRQGVIIIACTLALPLLVAAAGVAVWWRRRSL